MKTYIDRDMLLEHLKSLIDEDEEYLYKLGAKYIINKVELFLDEERYSLQEAAQIFIQKARNDYSDTPDIGEWQECVCAVVENIALEK